jgi:hypothetical protein
MIEWSERGSTLSKQAIGPCNGRIVLWQGFWEGATVRLQSNQKPWG